MPDSSGGLLVERIGVSPTPAGSVVVFDLVPDPTHPVLLTIVRKRGHSVKFTGEQRTFTGEEVKNPGER